MYGLFKNSYDWHKWTDLLCASNSKKKLIEYAKNSKNSNKYKLFVDGSESQEAAADNEETHYVIEEIDFLED